MKRLFALLLFSGFLIVLCKSGPTPGSVGSINAPSATKTETAIAELTTKEL